MDCKLILIFQDALFLPLNAKAAFELCFHNVHQILSKTIVDSPVGLIGGSPVPMEVVKQIVSKLNMTDLTVRTITNMFIQYRYAFVGV